MLGSLSLTFYLLCLFPLFQFLFFPSLSQGKLFEHIFRIFNLTYNGFEYIA